MTQLTFAHEGNEIGWFYRSEAELWDVRFPSNAQNDKTADPGYRTAHVRMRRRH
jgi:hypothetical protein